MAKIEFLNVHKELCLMVDELDGKLVLRIETATGKLVTEVELKPDQVCADVESFHPLSYAKKRKPK